MDEITFGDGWTATQIKIDGKLRWQLHHVRERGAMAAGTAHVALIEEIARLRRELADEFTTRRDGLVIKEQVYGEIPPCQEAEASAVRGSAKGSEGTMSEKKKAETAEHKCTLETLRAQHSITEDEYLFLKGGSNTPEIFQRIEAINRLHGTTGIGGVFYALEDQRISVGKAMQVVRRFLLTGEIEDYTRARER